MKMIVMRICLLLCVHSRTELRTMVIQADAEMQEFHAPAHAKDTSSAVPSSTGPTFSIADASPHGVRATPPQEDFSGGGRNESGFIENQLRRDGSHQTAELHGPVSAQEGRGTTSAQELPALEVEASAAVPSREVVLSAHASSHAQVSGELTSTPSCVQTGSSPHLDNALTLILSAQSTATTEQRACAQNVQTALQSCQNSTVADINCIVAADTVLASMDQLARERALLTLSDMSAALGVTITADQEPAVSATPLGGSSSSFVDRDRLNGTPDSAWITSQGKPLWQAGDPPLSTFRYCIAPNIDDSCTTVIRNAITATESSLPGSCINFQQITYVGNGDPTDWASRSACTCNETRAVCIFSDQVTSSGGYVDSTGMPYYPTTGYSYYPSLCTAQTAGTMCELGKVLVSGVMSDGTDGCCTPVDSVSPHTAYTPATSEFQVHMGIRQCITGIVQHEMGHILGLHHEQKRFDRDSYLVVNADNILDSSESQYTKISAAIETQNSFQNPYDFRSIMHYGEYAFCEPLDATDHAADPTNVVAGSSVGYSAYAYVKLNPCNNVSYTSCKGYTVTFNQSITTSFNLCDLGQYDGWSDCDLHGLRHMYCSSDPWPSTNHSAECFSYIEQQTEAATPAATPAPTSNTTYRCGGGQQWNWSAEVCADGSLPSCTNLACGGAYANTSRCACPPEAPIWHNRRCISAALCTSSDYNSTPPNPNGTELRSCMNRGGFAWDEFIHTDDTAMLTKLREKFGAPESESATDLCNRTNSGYADLCSCLEAQSFLSSGECSQLWEVEKRDTTIELLRIESENEAETLSSLQSMTSDDLSQVCFAKNFTDWCTICLDTTCGAMTNQEKHNHVIRWVYDRTTSGAQLTIAQLQGMTFPELRTHCSNSTALFQIAHYLIMHGDQSLCVDAGDCGEGLECVPDPAVSRVKRCACSAPLEKGHLALAIRSAAAGSCPLPGGARAAPRSTRATEAERKAFSAKFQNNYERALADTWFRHNFERALADTRDARDSEIERIKDLRNKVLDRTSGRGMLPSHA